MIISTLPVLGEVNILRYLARLFPALNYESYNAFEVDSMLDTAYLLTATKLKTKRAPLLKTISKALASSEWVCGDTFSLGDVAVYSAVKQVSEKDINVRMNKWLEKCEKL